MAASMWCEQNTYSGWTYECDMDLLSIHLLFIQNPKCEGISHIRHFQELCQRPKKQRRSEPCSGF